MFATRKVVVRRVVAARNMWSDMCSKKKKKKLRRVLCTSVRPSSSNTTARRSRLGRCGSLSESGRGWTSAFSFRLEARFLGRFVENVNHCVVSAVAVPVHGTDCCAVTEAVMDLAAQEALCILGNKRDEEAVLKSRSDKVGTTPEGVGAVSPQV